MVARTCVRRPAPQPVSSGPVRDRPRRSGRTTLAFLVALGEQHGLAVGVEPRSTRTPHHLVDLEDVQGAIPPALGSKRRQSRTITRRAGVLTPAASVGVAEITFRRAGCERRLRRYPLGAREAGVVKRRAAFDGLGQVLAGLGVAVVADVVGQFGQLIPFLAGQFVLRNAAQPSRGGLGVPAGVDEHERGAPSWRMSRTSAASCFSEPSTGTSRVEPSSKFSALP